MRVFRVAFLAGVLSVGFLAARTVPAFAQLTPGFRLNETKEVTDDEKAKYKANEDAARAARAKIPDVKQDDPWAGARNANAPSTPANAKSKKAGH